MKIIEKPSDFSTVIEYEKFQGVIFSDKALCFLCLQDKERFTPILNDIENAERILTQKIKNANKDLINQGNGCPIINRNLKNYRRQYFGYIDNNGDKIIYTTFVWDRYTLWDKLRGYYKDESENWKTEKEMVLDGCSYNWEIKINLNKSELFEFDVNGVA